MIVTVMLDKFETKRMPHDYDESLEGNIEWYKEELQNIEPASNALMYIDYKTKYDFLNLKKEYANKEEWKYECVSNNGEKYIKKINEIKYGPKYNKGNLESAEAEYQKFIEMLENDDWRNYAKERLLDAI